ncbi:hypothetical protein IV54_GL000759 [Levilactobacillus paucivorans]|uniref:DUF5776 domain-containing protein n=1 Tax=Levilactobacillus paucivorans TaxID=616990 RepID=A0A0R2LUR3_9LACO|nr:DUF5776 domain-containing protein [Levilactobacillus paucivorans]KRO04870.1 hypothetical protein IV54_GL000759 [Levilactobacillus paucivorans]
MNIQLINDVANNICTPEQAEQIYSQYMSGYPNFNVPDFEALAGAFGNNVIDQELLQERLAATVPYDGTSESVNVSLEVPLRDVDAHMTITYRTSDGTALPTAPFTAIGATVSGQTATKKITGYQGQVITDAQHTLIPEIPGYTASANSVTFDKSDDSTKNSDSIKEQPVTITYTKNSSPAPSSPNTSQSFRVYGKQKLYRYQHVDFKKSERIRKYATKPSAYAPVFTVVNTTQSKAGNPRYQLSDGSYITAKSAYVGKLFLEDETAKTLYVTNPKVIWTHTTTTFSDQLTHLKQGSQVAVTKLVKDGDTTRYQLADGTFVTGNQRYVTTDKPQWVTHVKAKGGRNLYSDVTLTHRLKHYRKGHIFTVKGWDYSYGHNQLISGTKRYKVAGGYITGNPKLVKIIK